MAEPEQVVPRGTMPPDGWASTGRVARDSGLGVITIGTIVTVGQEIGLIPPGVIESHPQTFMAITAAAPVLWRFIVKLFGRQKKVAK